MPERIFDWVFRTAMLVLAGMVTMSILGSIAAISSQEQPGGFSARPGPAPTQPEAEPDRPEPRQDGVPQGENTVEPAGPGAAGPVTLAPAPPPPEGDRWLEAIAYALLALAGVAAIGVLVLWRAARELREIREALLSRPPP